MVNSSSELPNSGGTSHETTHDATHAEAIFSRLNEERAKLDLFSMPEKEAESLEVEEFEDRRDAIEATPEYQEQLGRVREAESVALKFFLDDPETAVVQVRNPNELIHYLQEYDRHLAQKGMSKPERQQKALPVVERFSGTGDLREILTREGLIANTPPLGKRIMQAALQKIRGRSTLVTPKGPIVPK